MSKEIYLKVLHSENDIGLVSVNSEQAAKIVKGIYIKQGAVCTEVSKDEYVKWNAAGGIRRREFFESKRFSEGIG